VAVGRKNEEEIRFLIAKGLDINARGDYNTTPLALAASFGSIDIMRLLLQLGADPDINDCYGNSPKDLLWQKLCQ
jgi:ankyrin repeat protein